MKITKGTKFVFLGSDCYVGQYDNEIGITCYFIDTNTEAVCLNKNFLIEEFFTCENKEEIYNELFKKLTEQIINGVVYDNLIYRDGRIEWACSHFDEISYFVKPMECAYK
jgi:hypothetical protein